MFKKNKNIILFSLLIFILLITGCSNKDTDKLKSQETAFKVVDSSTGEIIKIASLSVDGAKVTGKEGLFKAPLTVEKKYNILAKSDGYKEYKKTYQAKKRNNIYEVKMDRYLLDIEGKITGDNDKLLEGAEVEIVELEKKVLTNNEGYYYIPDVPAGVGKDDKYTIFARKNNYSDISRKVHVCEKDSVVKSVSTSLLGNNITSNNNKLDRLVFTFDNLNIGNVDPDSLPGNISGKIVNSDKINESISEATISGAGKTVESDEDGNFIMEGVVPGNYTFNITKDRYEEKFISNVVVEGNQTKNLGNIKLKGLASGFGNLDVTVYDESGNIISANVTLTETGTTVTSGTGIEFENIPEGTHNIRASKSGYFTKTATATVLSDQTTSFSMDLISEEALSDKGYVQGYFTLDDGRPLVGSLIEIGGYGDTTDKNGYFSIKLPEGTYTSIYIPNKNYSYTPPSSISIQRHTTYNLNLAGKGKKFSFSVNRSSGSGGSGVDRTYKLYHNSPRLQISCRNIGQTSLKVYNADTNNLIANITLPNKSSTKYINYNFKAGVNYRVESSIRNNNDSENASMDFQWE